MGLTSTKLLKCGWRWGKTSFRYMLVKTHNSKGKTNKQTKKNPKSFIDNKKRVGIGRILKKKYNSDCVEIITEVNLKNNKSKSSKFCRKI